MGFENGKLVRVTMKAEQSGGFLQVNTFHYDLDDSGGQGANDPQALADFFRDTVVPKYQALYNTSWTIAPVLVAQEKDPQNANAARKEWVSGAPVSGTKTAGSEPLALALCAVATLKTEHIGRRHTGRLFLGGSLHEDEIFGNAWQTNATVLWQNLLNVIPQQPDLVSGASAAVANWVVYSRTNRGEDIDPYASRVITPVLHSKVHWLRSRDD